MVITNWKPITHHSKTNFINQLLIGIVTIELDDGKIYRKALYLMVKTNGFPVKFPLNQSNDFNQETLNGI